MKNIAMDHCVSHSHGDFLPITKTARTTKRDAKREGRASRYLVALLIVSPCFQFFFLFIILYTHRLTVHCSVFILAHPLSTRCHTYSKNPFTRHFTKMTKSLVFVRSFVSKHPLVTERNFLIFKSNTKRASLLIKKKKENERNKSGGLTRWNESSIRRSLVGDGALRVSGRRNAKSSSGRRTSGYWGSRRKHGKLPVRRLGHATRKLVSLSFVPSSASIRFTPSAILASSSRSAAPVQAARARELSRPKAG